MGRNLSLLAGLGGAAVVLGVAVAFSPGLTSVLSLPSIPVVAVGVVAFFFAATTGMRRRDTRFRRADPPAVEAVADYPRPGDDVDESIGRAHGPGIQAARNRRETRETLGGVAVAVLQLTEGYSRAEAVEALETGSWTDDPFAAACFASDPPEEGLGDSLTRYLTGRSRYQTEIQHAIDELDDRLYGEGRP